MKAIASFFISSLFTLVTFGQVVSVENMFPMISFAEQRFDNQLSLKGFAFTGKENQKDTLLRMYDYRRTRSFKNIDSISRSITRGEIKDGTFITYETASFAEFRNMKAQLKNAGFFCNHRDIGDTSICLLYQNKDMSVRTFIRKEDSITRYSLQFHKKIFPRPKDIYYANDLLSFCSHEYLVYYFGAKNIKDDMYFLPGNKIARCSVLFPNTSRQVVFIWGDEENRCTISSVLLGAQLNLKSSLETSEHIAENNWVLKSGVHPGMSLLQLRLLNGNDFRFHGGRSMSPGSVIPDIDGKLDFKKEEIILGCLNCNDDKFTTATLMSADDCIDAGRLLFVLSVILHP